MLFKSSTPCSLSRSLLAHSFILSFFFLSFYLLSIDYVPCTACALSLIHISEPTRPY